ncbi:hypothetical protein VT84_17145 [Gemmata sp. SH-PL17]|uniref:hypothetical protein n=1 Tax=Gemmata sp. SH-PL17 TaxID=1630693 RepID=UPI00078C273E|nr:hypothetical protein [Gemmata sp. SH-PL17]AMV26128.1 hypothetical protein VT84_17145 [Gemmata sp. SH-PL17]
MVRMAEEKPKKSTRGRPPKHPGDADGGGRTGVPVNIRMDPTLRDLVPKFIDAFRQKNLVRLDLTSTVELALTELFIKWGLLPDPNESK